MGGPAGSGRGRAAVRWPDAEHQGPWGRAVAAADAVAEADLANLFGFVERGTTTRRFRNAVMFVARGNGKTILAAPIALYLTFVEDEWVLRAMPRR